MAMNNICERAQHLTRYEYLLLGAVFIVTLMCTACAVYVGLWILPRSADHSDRYRLASACAEIKPGMTYSEAVALLHQKFSFTHEEADFRYQEYDFDGCVVTLDSLKGHVTSSRLRKDEAVKGMP